MDRELTSLELQVLRDLPGPGKGPGVREIALEGQRKEAADRLEAWGLARSTMTSVMAKPSPSQVALFWRTWGGEAFLERLRKAGA
jgi:hypothetical protein